MVKSVSNDPSDSAGQKNPGGAFHALSLSILQQANTGNPLSDFLRQCTKIMIEFTGCDSVGIYLAGDPVKCYCECSSNPDDPFTFDMIKPDDTSRIRLGKNLLLDDEFLRNLIIRDVVNPPPNFTCHGSFWVCAADDLPGQIVSAYNISEGMLEDTAPDLNSLTIIPIAGNGKSIGALLLKCAKKDFFTADDIDFYEGISSIIGVALMSCRAQAALSERVKELSCLYRIAQIAAEPKYTLDQVIQNTLGILAPAWQYPEITVARIVLDGKMYSMPVYLDEWQSQRADIIINGKNEGFIEVAYSETMPELDEGPFLKEERNLIDAVARLVAQIIEGKQAEEDRLKLQNQLRHADRLATIGQLSAGVAHEFNEPLGNILGFAQLILKNKDLPDESRKDIEKIITASMHAREVVKKLMVFARQLPSKRDRINLNKVIEDGLYFLEARCAKAGIAMIKSLARDLPHITADQAQIHQVLVNLVVNAIQAMPYGGTIHIVTKRCRENVSFSVIDTGTGMTPEVKRQLFIPFFTTKDVNEGTGLGLPVVHGIVTSHGGTIEVTSEVGKGSCFEIILPIDGPTEVEVSQ